MLVTKPQKLLPIHLAPIDSFFIEDDRPEYPMTFASNLFFDGEFQRDAFEAALAEALALHPLLHALVRPAKQNKPCWVAADQLDPVLDWGAADQPVDLEQREAIDLKRETGLRVWVRQADGRAHLILQFHHACCDGTGAHRFMGDLLAAYGARTTPLGQRPPQVATYDRQLLKTRRNKLAEMYLERLVGANIKRALGQGVHVFGPRITPLRANRRANRSQGTAAVRPACRTYPPVVSYKFNAEEHKQLRHAAGQQGVTLNDLLLAEMFHTMREWNLLHGGSNRGRLRIMMPSDMRTQEDFAMPAANMTSYNFITRPVRDCDDPASLVRSIRDETVRIKGDQRGKIFIDSYMIAKRVPGLMPFLLSGRRCLSTVTVSHMGDPTRRFLATFPRVGGKLVCGDVVLEDMVGVSPLRPQTRAAVSIVTLYRQLAINVRLDPHVMSVEDAQAFVGMYAERLAGQLFGVSLDSELVAT